MANEKKFSQFTNGNETQISDQMVGLRGGVNFRFDFPGDGIKDSSGNYLFQYATVGAAAVNYLTLTNANAGDSVTLSADGDDANINLAINPKGTAALELDGLTWPTADGASNTLLTTDGAGQLSFSSSSFPVSGGTTNHVLRSDGSNWVESANLTLNSSDALAEITKAGFTEISNPSTPAANKLDIYARDQNGITRAVSIDSTGVITNLGGDVMYVVRNTTGSTITKGSPVYISGATGNIANVSLAQADSASTMPTLGLVVEDITNNGFGRVMSKGIISDIDTSSFNEGDILYVSPSAAGEFVNARPAHPNLQQQVGLVTISGVGNGKIEVDNLTALGDELGTRQNNFAVGDDTAGAKTFEFSNGNSLSLSANPTGTRTVTIQDATTTLVGRDTTDTLTNKSIDGNNNTLTNIGAANVNLANISGSTYSTVQNYANFSNSTGLTSGGTISDAGSGNIDVAAGTGFIRAMDSDIAELKFFDWSASNGNAIPSGSTRFVGVEYNGGSPQIVIKTTNTWDYDTDFPLGVVVNEGGTLYIENNPWKTGDSIGNFLEVTDAIAQIYRDSREQGLILSNTGTRNVAVTAGQLMERVTEFPIAAIDTSGSDTFDAYYRDGGGGWTKQASQTQWNNTQYDDGSGTLATISLLAYSSRWFYLMSDGSLAMLYGQADFSSLGTAINDDSPPSTVPERILELGILIGRFIIQRGASTPSVTQSAFDSPFSPTVVSDHGNLSGLAADDHTQYVLVDGSRAMTGGLSIDGSSDEIQLKVQGHSTQTSNILEIEDSSATNLLTVDNSGALTTIADATIRGVTVGLGNSTGSSNLAYGTNASATSTSGSANSAIGHETLNALSTGSNNTAVGHSSMQVLTSGSMNTAVGRQCLNAVVNGTSNAAVGESSLRNSTASFNTAMGKDSALNNTSGANLVAIGYSALSSNTTSDNNVAIGYQALQNVDAVNNTAVGYKAGKTTTSSTSTAAFGFQSLTSLTSGNENSGFGSSSLGSATTGASNSAFGSTALFDLTTGSNNVGVGIRTGRGLISGATALTTGSNNTFIGRAASSDAADAADCIAIGKDAIANSATGATSGDDGASIAIGSSGNPVGFRGDDTIYPSTNGSDGYWRVKVNGTFQKIELRPDSDTLEAFRLKSVESGITASGTQTQGQQPLTNEVNEVSTVGTTDDVVTLPSANAGQRVLVINNGANQLQIFPASGDDLGAGVDSSTTLASGSNQWFTAYDATNWEQV